MEYWHGTIHFKELQLTNFRQFKSLNLAFHERLTVLIGENGSGKTTVLEAVAKSMRLFSEQMNRANMNTSIVRDFFFVSDINNEEDISQIDVKVLINIETGLDTKKIEMKESEKADRLEDINRRIQYFGETSARQIEELRMNYLDNLEEFRRQKEDVENERDQKISELKREEKTIEGKPPGESELNWNVAIEKNIKKEGSFSDLRAIEIIARELEVVRKSTENISIPFFKYYPCRDMDNTPLNRKSNGDRYYERISLADEESPTIEIFTTWYRRILGQSAEKNDFRLLNQIQKAIYELLSDEKSHRFDNLRLSYLNEEKPDGELWINKNGVPLRLEQLSSGETMLFLLVTDLARRFVLANPNSVEPYKTGSAVILIDEVDLHLHPQWQIKVLGKLCSIFPKAQFVVTTHSPLILSNLNREQICWLEQGEILQVPHSKGRDYTSLLFEFMGVPMRPFAMQSKLEKLFMKVEEEALPKSSIKKIRQKIEEIKKDVGENDPDVIKLENILNVLEE